MGIILLIFVFLDVSSFPCVPFYKKISTCFPMDNVICRFCDFFILFNERFFVTRSIVLDPRSAVRDLNGDTWNNTTILYFFNIEPSFVGTLLFLCKFLITVSSRRTFALTSKLSPQNWMLRNQSYRLWSHGLSSVQGHNESTGLQCPLAFACWRQTLVSSVDSAWEALMERELRRGTRPL